MPTSSSKQDGIDTSHIFLPRSTAKILGHHIHNKVKMAMKERKKKASGQDLGNDMAVSSLDPRFSFSSYIPLGVGEAGKLETAMNVDQNKFLRIACSH